MYTTVNFFDHSVWRSIMLTISLIVYLVKGEYLFNLSLFSKDGSGINILETLTYHCLAIGFIAMTLRPVDKSDKKGRSREIVNSGIIFFAHLANSFIDNTKNRKIPDGSQTLKIRTLCLLGM